MAVFCGLAVAVYSNFWRDGAPHVVLGQNDMLQTMWFLNWVPYALGHGLNPFHTSLVNIPYGVNLLDQTSVPLLGLLLAPITVLFGPVAALNVGMTLALAGSATSMYFVVQRFTSWRPSAFVAGLLYGFGPYEIGQGEAHLHMAFAVLPPLMLLLIHDIALIRDGRARRRGVILGLLVVAQFFISLEMLLETMVIAAVMLVAFALMRPSLVRTHVRDLTVGLAWGGEVAAIGLAYPTWYALRGPEHVTGAYHNPAYYRADLLGAIVPDGLMRIAPQSLASRADLFGGNFVENGSYLGLTLIFTLVVGGVWLWRRAEVRVVTFVGAAAFVFSLGSKLVVRAEPSVLSNGSASGGIPLPWAIVGHVPLFSNILPVRFSLFVAMFAALLLAMVLDQIHATAIARGFPVAATAVPAAVAAVALIPLFPAVPYNSSIDVPQGSYFTSASVQNLPAGKVALLYPFPSGTEPQGMVWQTEAGMQFSMPGGYFIVPQGASGQRANTRYAYADYTSTIATALSDLYARVPPDHSPGARHTMRQELLSWHVQSAIALPAPGTARMVVAYLSWLIGAPPIRQSGAYAWYDLGRTLRPA